MDAAVPDARRLVRSSIELAVDVACERMGLRFARMRRRTVSRLCAGVRDVYGEYQFDVEHHQMHFRNADSQPWQLYQPEAEDWSGSRRVRRQVGQRLGPLKVGRCAQDSRRGILRRPRLLRHLFESGRAKAHSLEGIAHADVGGSA